MIDLQAIFVIWLREVKRVWRDKSQVLIGTVRPVTWLFFMGYGLGSSFQTGRGGPAYTQFVLPGMVAMALLFTAIQSSISIIWDREFGFLKEMLVAPISRTSIVFGKALGGSTLAVVEAFIVLLLAPVVGLRPSAAQLARCLGVMVLLSLSLSTLGIAIAARMKSFEGFGAIMNFLVMPLFLLSGALFPLDRLPGWLGVLVRINPVSYGVDLLRGTLLGSFHYAPAVSISVMSGFAAAMTFAAVQQFNQDPA